MMGNKVGRNSLARSSTAQRSDKYPLMRGDATSVNSFFVNVAKKSSKDVTCDNSSQIHISSSLCDGPEVDEETVSQEDTSTFQDTSASKLLTIPLSDLVIPDHILNKLTTEDWNELIHIFCHSLETSLKLTILPTIEVALDASTCNPPPVERKQLESCSGCYSHRPKGTRQHCRNPVSSIHKTKKLHEPVLGENCHHMDSSRPHSLTWLESEMPHFHCQKRSSHNSESFITLGQLKDMGLTLNTDDIGNTSQRVLPLHKNSPVSSVKKSSTVSAQEFEELCFLGPAEDEGHSSASDVAVVEYGATPTSFVKVHHLHKHRHKHIHLFHATTCTSTGHKNNN